MESAGYAPPTLDVFVGTFNVGECRPPTDTSILTKWIPPRKVCVCRHAST